jgi:hypothetical protein
VAIVAAVFLGESAVLKEKGSQKNPHVDVNKYGIVCM